MNSQLKALERVCDKRHAKIMQRGANETKASCVICRYLRGWIARQHSKANIFFAQSLLEGYTL